MKTGINSIIMENKVFLWIAGATGLLLLIPLIAMQFTKEVNWTLLDFVVMGVLLFGTGSLFVLTARRLHGSRARIIAGIVIAVAFFYLWAELAVGIFTNWGS